MAGPAAKQFGDSLLLAIEQAPKIMAQRVHAKSKLSPNCFLAAVAGSLKLTDQLTALCARLATPSSPALSPSAAGTTCSDLNGGMAKFLIVA